jgi:hypothetical protein
LLQPAQLAGYQLHSISVPGRFSDPATDRDPGRSDTDSAADRDPGRPDTDPDADRDPGRPDTDPDAAAVGDPHPNPYAAADADPDAQRKRTVTGDGPCRDPR